MAASAAADASASEAPPRQKSVWERVVASEGARLRDGVRVSSRDFMDFCPSVDNKSPNPLAATTAPPLPLFFFFMRNYGATQNIYCLKANLDLCLAAQEDERMFDYCTCQARRKALFPLLPLLPILLGGDNSYSVMLRVTVGRARLRDAPRTQALGVYYGEMTM